ncbi:MAG: macro domain-containing protein [Paludibacteraceae bacterium]|nr:macro domain-containing protein [Paludibacteraceae bacterium]
MIHYVKGNLLESNAQALVNTVNTVGVMGKGIALQFKEAFPENFRVYYNACRKKELHVGNVLVVEDSNLTSGPKLIVNFPTKTHWRYPSEYSYIEQGLQSLRREIQTRHIQSIAIPPLGSHNGGLDWRQVKQMIEKALGDLDCDMYLYEPSDVIIERMKSERAKLTPARAMLLTMLADLTRNGEFASVFAAEKLVYFMQRLGAADIFKVEFKPYYYGPYSGGKVAHVLYALNGSYIKGMGGMEKRPFDYIWLLEDAEREASLFIDGAPNAMQLRDICEKTKLLLRDYYSNYSLELLASVDYLLNNVPELHNWKNDNDDDVLDKLTVKIQNWSKRKEQMFKRNYLSEAYHYLKEQNELM